MKRNWTIVKEILEAIETNQIKTHWESLPEEQHDLVLLHYELLEASGLISNYQMVNDVDIDGFSHRHPLFWKERPGIPSIRLTMKGYDLLEVLRDQALWNRIINKAKSLGVKLTFEFIKQAIPVIYKQLL